MEEDEQPEVVVNIGTNNGKEKEMRSCRGNIWGQKIKIWDLKGYDLQITLVPCACEGRNGKTGLLK